MKKENSMRLKFAGLLLLVLTASLALIGCQSQKSRQSNEGNATLVIKGLGAEKTERFKFSDSTPFDILNYNHRVETSLDRDFIKCIDDACADGDYIWLFYVNNKTINYGAKVYNLMDGDIIMFELTNKNTGGKR